jgi:hypothetical protein
MYFAPSGTMSGMDGGVRFTPRIPSQEPSFARSNNGWSPRGGADGADARCALSVPSTPLAFASMVGGSRPGREKRPGIRNIESGARSPRSMR